MPNKSRLAHPLDEPGRLTPPVSADLQAAGLAEQLYQGDACDKTAHMRPEGHPGAATAGGRNGAHHLEQKLVAEHEIGGHHNPEEKKAEKHEMCTGARGKSRA